jgi:exosortase/archaeosortase family protein
LLAQEEVERLQKTRQQTLKPSLLGSPDERTAWLKQLWWQLPRYVRPMLYFTYRMLFQLGILEGRTGVIFHFLQGFWFRLIVDVKIDEILKSGQYLKPANTGQLSPLKFVFRFLALFLIFYYFNILFFGITNPGKHYYPFLANHFNYIERLRWVLLSISAQILNWLGFLAIHNGTELLVAGKGTLGVVYSCLGLGLMSFFAAFVIAYPKKTKQKVIFLITGILTIQFLNILRFVLLALFWNKNSNRIVDHHTVFNIILYTIIMISLYFWVKQKDQRADKHV